MQRQRTLSLATIIALVASLLLTAIAGANPPAPGDAGAQPAADLTVGPSQTNLGKTVDQPNPYDYWRNRERQRLLSNGQYLEAQSLAVDADDRVLVVLVEFAGTDTFTWKPGDQWDPIGKADPNEAVYDEDGNVVVGDCSNIITETKTFTYSGPLHNRIPRPVSASDRSANTIWTEDFSKGWFEAFMWGDGVKFNYTREDGSVVSEDFTGKSVKDYYLDMSGGKYEIAGDVVGWVQVPHSTWYYDADQCPGARSGGGGRGAIPGAGNARELVKDSLDAVNAISNTIPGFNWQNYDQDKDGIIDRLWIVHAGYGEEDSTTLLNRTDYSEAAVWSHSSAVTPPYKVSKDVAAGPYIIMPENGGIGVFAHEYGHNLGAMDLYAYDMGETSAGFWTLMADDWTGYPIGYQPPSVDPMHLDWWGWLDPMVVSDPAQTYQFKLGQASKFPGGNGVYRGAKIELPDGVLNLPVPVWQGSHYWWGGADELANGQMVTKAPVAIPAGGATLSFDLVYDIEEEWDFLWVQASEDGGATWKTLTNANTRCDHVKEWVGGLYGFPEDLCAAGIGGFTGYNENWPDPEAQTFDLAAFAGKNVLLRAWYMTDWGTQLSGPFIDNVKVMAGGQTLVSDDAETDSGLWNLVAPFERNDGTRTFGQRFYLQWRNVGKDGGYDSALGHELWRYGPANTGLTVWYENEFYADNEVWHYLTDAPGFGPKGRMLVVDAHPEPYRDPGYVAKGYPNEIANTDHRGQMRDATFSLKPTVPFKFPSMMPGAPGWNDYASRPAIAAFHDSYGYYPGAEFVMGGPVGQTSKRWITKQWDASTVMPSKEFYGVKAPGYNAKQVFRMNCSLNALGQNLCYGYGGGLGYDGGSGNPGDVMGQYGWHVQIVDQTDQIATVRVWNSLKEIMGEVRQTPSSDPLVLGSTVKVDVHATNVGSPVNGLFIAPLDDEEAYVEGSATGGAFPVTAAQARELAGSAGVASVEGLRSDAAAGEIVAMAAMAKPGAGGAVHFGFTTVVTEATGDIHHSVAVFDGSTFLNALHGDHLMIEAAAQAGTKTFAAAADTHIGMWAGGGFGAWPFMYVGADDTFRSVLKFDTSAIDKSYPVDEATLWVYVSSFGGGGSAANLASHELKTAWQEATVGWYAPWTAPGGDVNATPDGVTPITKMDAGKWVKVDVTESAQKWVADPAMNHGVLLRLADATSYTTYRLVTRDNGWMTENAPKLEVKYRMP
jgi:immune inhibitor A